MPKKNNKQKQAKKEQNESKHVHGSGCSHVKDHDHDHDHGDGHQHQKQLNPMPSADLFSELTSFSVKPEDPLPNFDDFDKSIQISQSMIEEFQKIVSLLQAKKYVEAGVQDPPPPQQQVPQTQNKKQTPQQKQQQLIRDKNIADFKQKIDAYSKKQVFLEGYLNNPIAHNIKNEIMISIQGFENDKKETNEYIKLLEMQY